MEQLLKLAKASADQADIYWEEVSYDHIEFTYANLEKVDSSLSYALALRVIKDGKCGLAHTRNLLDAKELVKQALTSAKDGQAVGFQLPASWQAPDSDCLDTRIETIDKALLIAQGKELLAYLKARSDAQVNLSFNYGSSRIGLQNSYDLDLAWKGSTYSVWTQMVFPGSGAGLMELAIGRGPVELDKIQLDRMLELFKISSTQVVPPTCKMPVIFTPLTVGALFSRFYSAISAVNIHNGISPLCNRVGERIFSDKLTIRQQPRDLELASSTAFDNEGTPTQELYLLKNGVFMAIPTDLNYAHKLGLEPTGNGFRPEVEYMPGPRPFNTSLQTGDMSLDAMIASIDKGLIVHSLMGAHSGNILNGDYSVGVSSGFLIENGKIVARVKDCMLSGNVYETLNNVIAIGSEATALGSSKLPALLCDGVSVAGK